MARRKHGQNREMKSHGTGASVAKTGGTLGLHRAGQQELSSVRSANGMVEPYTEGLDPLHQLIAERAYLLYERSGFQDGHDMEHWLEAERQIKGVRDQAA